MQSPLRVAVTGAAGQIGYSLLFRIASGEMFGVDQPLSLQLIEIPRDKAMQALEGTAMELEDGAFPLVHEIKTTSDPAEGFAEASWCLLVGSKPRGPGMERADLLKDNGRIFVDQGKALDANAADDARVVVVGNPCNTNCMIAASQARRLPAERFTAMVRLDQNRAAAQLAKKANALVRDVSELFIFGNHSPTMFPAFELAQVNERAAAQVIADEQWLKNDFLETVGQRGRAIIQARGSSSAASAANALVDHVRALRSPGTRHSIAVKTDGAYGFHPDVWAGLPVRTTGFGDYEVLNDFQLDAFATERLAKTNEELVSERRTVSEMIG